MADENIPAPPPGFRPLQTQTPVTAVPAPPPGFSPLQTQPASPAGFAPVPQEEQGWVDWALSKAAGAADVATDIGEGIISAPVTLAQGIAELPAIGFDMAFDTNTASAVSDFFKPVRDALAPETTAGKVTEDVVAFGLGFVPFAGWLGRAGQVAKGTRTAGQLSKGKGLTSAFMRSADSFGSSAVGKSILSSRAGQVSAMAIGAGTYEAIVSPDGRGTLSDNFEVMPDFLKTDQTANLSGREEAFRRIKNRVAAGLEGASLSAAFDTALIGAGALTREVAKVPQVAAAANAFSDRLSTAGSAIAKRFPKSAALATEYLTPTGGANRLLYEESEDAKGLINLSKKNATQSADEYNATLQSVINDAGIQGKFSAKILEDEVGQYLEGLRRDLPSLGDAAAQQKVMTKLDRMIDIGNEHTDKMMTIMEAKAREAIPGTPRAKLAEESYKTLKQTREAQGMHLRRSFEQYKNPVKFYRELDLTSPKAKKAQQEVAENIAMMEGREATDPEVLLRAKDVVLRTLDLGTLATTKGMSEKQIVDLRLAAAKEATEGRGKLGSLVSKERPEFVTDKGLFIEQEEILSRSPALLDLKGEIKDPIQRYLDTIEETARSITASKFYDALPNLPGVEKSLYEAVEQLNAGQRPAVVSVPDLRSMTDEQYEAAMQPFAKEAMEVNTSQARGTPGLGVPARPSVDRVTREDMRDQYVDLLRKNGYIQLGEASADDVFGGIYGSASGKFVAPETYRAITQPLRLSQNWAGEMLGALSTFRNFTQKMTIVPNPAAQVRNILGNVGFLAGNANLPNGGDISDLFYTFVKSLEEVDDAGLTRLANKLTAGGLADVNLVTRALKEYRDAASDLTATGKLTRALDKFEGIIPFMRQFENLYSNSDTFFKGAALLAEESKMLNILNKVGINQLDPLFWESMAENGLLTRAVSEVNERGLLPVEMMAAEVVKDTMPTYNRVVKAVRLTDAVPIIGNFTSFAAENIRNSVGTVTRGVREMGFEASPALRAKYGDAKINELERLLRAGGLQRTLAYTSMAYILPKTMVRMSMAATGTTPEQMAALYEMNPDFLNGHDLVVLENNKEKGYIDFIDLSYVMPYAFMTDPASAAIRQFQESGRADKSLVSSTINGMYDAFMVFADPFASETMFYERLRDVMPTNMLVGRGGVTSTGALIYGPNEDPASKASKIFNHLIMGFAPNYATLIAEERAGQMQYGRLVRAMSGLPDRQGEVTNPAKEIGRLVTGFTPMRLNTKTDARYKGSEYIPLRSDSRSRALAAIKDATITAQGVRNTWSQYLDELYRAQSKLYRDVEAMRTLNMTDDQIRYALINQAGLGAGEANGIIDGRFSPSIPSVELGADIQDQLNREGRVRLLDEINFDELNKMTEDRVDEPLRSAMPEPSTAPISPPPGFQPFQPGVVVPPPPPGFVPYQEGAVQMPPIPQVAPSMLPMPAPAPAPATRTAALTPSLLGGTLAEQAANAEIAQRIG